MVCDLAETYHILDDYRALPLRLVARLVFGLRPSSRIKMRAAGIQNPLETALLAGVMDSLRVLVWQNTEAGHKGRNAPKPLLGQVLYGTGADEAATPDIQGFDSGADFERARAEILNLNGKEAH